MATHSITVQVTDGQLHKLQEREGFVKGDSSDQWHNTAYQVAQQVLNNAPELKRYIQVGDVLAGGEVVKYASPYVIVAGAPRGFDEVYQSEEYGHWLVMKDRSRGYFPEAE